MRPPTATDIPAFAGKLEAYYAEWLRKGLADYVHGSRKRTAFPFVSAYIGLREGIAEDLADIFDALSVADQIEFRKGCARALDELDFSRNEEAALAELLIRLAAHIRAHQVLNVLAGKAFANLTIRGADRLYDLVLDVAQELAGPAHFEGAACLAHIIGELGSRIRPAQARTALLGLAISAPKDLVEHMRLLARPLAEAYGDSGMLAGESGLIESRKDLIVEVAARVPFDGILEAASDPAIRFPDADPFRIENTDWWFKTIWDDADPMLDHVRYRLKYQNPKRDCTWNDVVSSWARWWSLKRPPLMAAADDLLENNPLFGDPTGPRGKALLDEEYTDSLFAGAG